MKKQNVHSEHEFRSPDLYYAAYLQTAGVAMIRTERESNGRVYFIFNTELANMEELKNAWFNNSGKVPALAYSMAVRSLKSLCHHT